MLSEKPWQLEKVLLFCAALFFCLCLAAVARDLLSRLGVTGFRHLEDFGSVVLGTLSFQGLAWVFILVFLRQHRVHWRDAFGFRGPDLKHALLLAVRVAIVILPVAWLLLTLSDLVLTRPGDEPAVQNVVKLIEGSTSPWMQIYLGVFAVAVVPVAEEFIFRGMLYPFIKRLGYPRLAWIGVSVLFALIHQSAITFVPLFALALALTWLYEKTDNLLAPITTHVIFNAANLAWMALGRLQDSPPHP